MNKTLSSVIYSLLHSTNADCGPRIVTVGDANPAGAITNHSKHAMELFKLNLPASSVRIDDKLLLEHPNAVHASSCAVYNVYGLRLLTTRLPAVVRLCIRALFL